MWIKYKDTKPGFNKIVLVVTEDGTFDYGITELRAINSKEVRGVRTGKGCIEPKYWMYLPEIPKKKKIVVTSCDECPLYTGDKVCGSVAEEIDNTDSIPDWCPLEDEYKGVGQYGGEVDRSTRRTN